MSECNDKEIGKLIHAYELNNLADDDIERFETHMLQCEYCFERVREFELYAREIRSSYKIQEKVKKLAEKYRPSISDREKGRRNLFPESALSFRSIFLYLLILVIVVPGFFVVKGLIKSDETQVIRLMPTRMSYDNVFRIGAGIDGTIYFGLEDIDPQRDYQIVITAEDGREVVRYDRFSDFDIRGAGKLSFPLEKMQKGRYSLIISEREGDRSVILSEYRFKIID